MATNTTGQTAAPQSQAGAMPVMGHGIQVPIVNPAIDHSGRVATPEWMIAIDDLLSSTVEGFDKACELLGWYAEAGRITTGNTANQLFTTATVQHSNVVIVIPNGIFGPTIEVKMNTGANLALIKISRIANITDQRVPLQEIEYTNCKIETIQQQLDRLVVTFRPETRQNTVYKYKQDGSKEGQAVSKYDYTTAKGE